MPTDVVKEGTGNGKAEYYADLVVNRPLRDLREKHGGFWRCLAGEACKDKTQGHRVSVALENLEFDSFSEKRWARAEPALRLLCNSDQEVEALKETLKEWSIKLNGPYPGDREITAPDR